VYKKYIEEAAARYIAFKKPAFACERLPGKLI